MHTYILAQKQPSLPHPFHPSSLFPLCLVFPFLPLASFSPSLSSESLAYHGSSQSSCAPQENPQSRKVPPPFHLGEWMSRTRGLVRVARCWAHVLRGKGCEGASEGGGEACEVRKACRDRSPDAGQQRSLLLPRCLSFCL